MRFEKEFSAVEAFSHSVLDEKIAPFGFLRRLGLFHFRHNFIEPVPSPVEIFARDDERRPQADDGPMCQRPFDVIVRALDGAVLM